MSQFAISGNLVYLAGPIDDVSSVEAKNWRAEIVNELSAINVGTFDPSRAYSFNMRNEQDCHVVDNINRYALARCRYVLIYLDGPGKAIGTIRELEYASSLHKDIVVVFDTDIPRVALAGIPCYPDLNKAVAYIKKREAEIVWNTDSHPAKDAY